MNNLIADGALHEHEVKLLLLVLHCVLFSCLSTDEAHCCVGQDGLQKKYRGRKISLLQHINIIFWNYSSWSLFVIHKLANPQLCHSQCLRSFKVQLQWCNQATCDAAHTCYLWIQQFIGNTLKCETKQMNSEHFPTVACNHLLK